MPREYVEVKTDPGQKNGPIFWYSFILVLMISVFFIAIILYPPKKDEAKEYCKCCKREL